MESPKHPSSVPKPEENLSQGTQLRSDPRDLESLARIAETPGEFPNYFGEAIDAVSEIRGPSAMLFVNAGVKQLGAEVGELRERLGRAEEQRDNWRSRFEEERVKCAVLNAEIQARRFLDKIQNVALALGGTILGAGLSAYTDQRPMSFLSILAGSALMIFGAARFPVRR
jgi:hypothetical protein